MGARALAAARQLPGHRHRLAHVGQLQPRFRAGASDADCAHAFDGLLLHLARLAKADRSALLAVKSLDRSEEVLGAVLGQHSYKRATSVPLAMLDLPYFSLDHYLNSLPGKTGSYFRRKMRSAKKVRIEYRSSIAGLEARSPSCSTAR